ncbi:Na+:solute symporter [Algivirga pacifica]|uniref:Na+:solute symporter n=2 Tax=Algivirga pacifica TaxID=1162670 RepID=A0ABP9D8T4_9BACT
MVLVGLYFQRKASSGIHAYFLGEGKMPWWALGASGMASNLDVSGTMINVAFIYALGAVGYFIEIRGGIVLIMAFMMTFMGQWNRRAKVMTMAEWMKVRFGEGRQGKMARLITAVAMILSSISIVTYFAMGAGKFIGEFLGLPDLLGFPAEFWAATLMIALSMIYTVSAGIYGVVWTDVFQGVLIMLTIVAVCVIAWVGEGVPEVFSTSLPLADGTFKAVETNRESWSSLIPSMQLDFLKGSAYEIYSLFGVVITFYLVKVIVEGASGTGGYIIQRFYAAKSDREVGLLTLFWTFLLSFRWPLVAAIAILGIRYGVSSGNPIEDPEKVLPTVIQHMIPTGLKGLLVAGLMAAAMSTFDSIVNSGASYWVKDIYQAFINPKASEKTLMRHSKWSSVVIVLSGLFMTLGIRSINEIYGWITVSLGAGLGIPLLLRWYWSRFNGYGFAIGTFMGMLGAITQKLWVPEATEYLSFVLISGVALSGCLLGTWLTEPTADNVLSEFYKITRPIGNWSKFRTQFSKEKLKKIDQENRRGIVSGFVAMFWQLSLFATGMMLVMKNWPTFWTLLGTTLVLSGILYFYWYRHLSEESTEEAVMVEQEDSELVL